MPRVKSGLRKPPVKGHTTRNELGRNPCKHTWYYQEAGSSVLSKVFASLNSPSGSKEHLMRGWVKYFSHHYVNDESLVDGEAKLKQRCEDWESIVGPMMKNGSWSRHDYGTQLFLGAYHERDDFYLVDDKIYTVRAVKRWIHHHPSQRPISEDSGTASSKRRRVRFNDEDEIGTTIKQDPASDSAYPCIPGACGPKSE